MEVRIESVPPQRVAFMRHTGPYPGVGQTWEKLYAWAARRGLLGPTSRFIGVGHDDPHVTPPEKVRYDACLSVDEKFRPEGEVGVQEVGGGEFAVTTHRGPYEKLHETYERLCGQWLPRSGRELRPGPGFEVYRNSPESTPPEDLLTDVYLPLAPR